MSSYRHSLVIAFLVSVITTTGIVVATRLPAQTGTTIVDAPPSISLTVNTANSAVNGYRPGVSAYYSTTVTDDKSLTSVVVTTSQMLYSGTTNDMSYQCQGKTFCEWKVYSITPATAGAHFVTVTATDGAGQVSTKTVNFDTVACATDADCGGGGSIQWAGATYCGAESGGLPTSIMQYGIAATCKAGGICDTSSLPRIKQACVSGQVCSSVNANPTCIAQPSACSLNAEIITTCACGNVVVTPPSYWERYCCNTYGSINPQHSECPSPSSSVSSSSVWSALSSHSASASTLSVSSWSTSSTLVPAGRVPLPFGSTPSVPVTTPPPGIPSVPSAPPAGVVHPSAPRTSTGGHVRIPSSEKGKEMGAAERKREGKLLKGKITSTKKKIASVERNIASLEKKIDGKLQLLDRAKSKEVRRRLSAQVDRWEGQIAVLEKEKKQLEVTLESLREAFEQRKAAAE